MCLCVYTRFGAEMSDDLLQSFHSTLSRMLKFPEILHNQDVLSLEATYDVATVQRVCMPAEKHVDKIQ